MVYQGETVRITGTITNFAGTATDASSQSLQLYDPSGSASGSPVTTPTKSDTGIYYHDFDIAADADLGVWKVVWSATISGDTGIGVIKFRVEST
jgi:hypothetical protein